MAVVHVASFSHDLDVSDGPSVWAVLAHAEALVTLPPVTAGVLTLKVDGRVFDPTSNVPADATVLEVIEWQPLESTLAGTQADDDFVE